MCTVGVDHSPKSPQTTKVYLTRKHTETLSKYAPQKIWKGKNEIKTSQASSLVAHDQAFSLSYWGAFFPIRWVCLHFQ